MPTELQGAPPTEAELRAFVGPGSGYYLRRWATSRHGGLNWTALCLSGLWLLYRKMYRVALIIVVAVVLESVLEELVFVNWLKRTEVPGAVERAVPVAVSCICCAFGNRWYLSRVTRAIAVSRMAMDGDEEHLARLARQGGTNMWAPVGILLLFTVAALATVFAMDAFRGAGL